MNWCSTFKCISGRLPCGGWRRVGELGQEKHLIRVIYYSLIWVVNEFVK